MKNKINIDDFLILIYWIRVYYLLEGKKFNHDNLLMQAETYKLSNTSLDIKIHKIDDLMIDACQIYFKIKATEDQVKETYDIINIPLATKDMLIKETENYKRIFEDLIENCKYEDRGIQKGILMEKMSKYVADEEYEKAAVLRDMIKEC
jgi:protein-arginine kinase activator protein McsA